MVNNNLEPTLQGLVDGIKTDIIANYIVPNETGDLVTDLFHYLRNQLILRGVEFINSIQQVVIERVVSILSTSY